nr:unnamed protein product [Haemonchus contortus]
MKGDGNQRQNVEKKSGRNAKPLDSSSIKRLLANQLSKGGSELSAKSDTSDSSASHERKCSGDPTKSNRRMCKNCSMRNPTHIRENMYAKALEKYWKSSGKGSKPEAQASESTKDNGLRSNDVSPTCSSSDACSSRSLVSKSEPFNKARQLELLYAKSLEKMFTAQEKSSTTTREKRGESRTPRDTQGLYKTGITPQKEDRVRSSKNITSNTEDSITTLITKVDTTEKGITIGKAKNVYITIIRCACTSALNPSCPCKRSLTNQSCKIVNAKLLASESTDPRLHTPESDRRKFKSVKWSPGREVQLVVKRKPKAVPENTALTTAKAQL